jgi:hypothetical protein
MREIYDLEASCNQGRPKAISIAEMSALKRQWIVGF